MKQLITFTGLYFLSLAAFSFSKIVKEESFHISTIKNITASSSGGNYTISKYSGDSIVVRVSLECKDLEAYNSFTMKYMVNLTNTSGSLNLRTDKVPSTAGTLTYEIFLPSDIACDISSEKSNISIKDLKVNLKLNVIDGVLFADNLSGSLTVTTEKMDMDIKCTNLDVNINTKSSDVSFAGKGGKLTLINASGKSKITLTGTMDMDVQTTNGDINILLPKQIDCNLQATSVKKTILMSFEDILLKGTITPNNLKVAVGKGGNEIKFNTQGGDLTISNVNMLSK